MGKYNPKPCSFLGCKNKCAVFKGSRCHKHRLTPEEQEELRQPQIKCVCRRCGKEFFATSGRVRDGRGIYCSRKCKDGERIKCICKWCGKEFWKAPCFLAQGKGKHCSRQCSYSSKIIELCGRANPNWRGIKHHLNSIRKNKQGRLWVEEIKKRGACELCGSAEYLQAHHIIPLLTLFLERTGGKLDAPYDKNDKFFHNTDNGLLVCLECHIGLHPEIAVMKKALRDKKNAET